MFRTFKGLVPSFVLLVGLAAHATSTINNLDLSVAEAKFEKDILSSPGGVVTLAKPLRLYHYFNAATQGGQLWPTYQKISDRYREGGQIQFDIIYQTSSFWEASVHDTDLVNGGPGMYLAVDPLISEKYGHASYILNFPAGYKYIDFSDPAWKGVSKIKISKDTLVSLVKEGILTEKQISKLELKSGYFLRRAMQFIAAPENLRFREMVSKIFARNNISLVQYTWEKTGLKLFCKSASSSAFVFIGQVNMDASVKYPVTIPMDFVRSTVFTSKMSIQEQAPEAQEVVDLTQKFKSALEQGSKADLMLEEVQAIKDVTFGCE